MATYREDLRLAWNRINSFPTDRLETRFGTVEYGHRPVSLRLLRLDAPGGCHPSQSG